MAKGFKLNYIRERDIGGPVLKTPFVAVWLPGQRLLVEYDADNILLNYTHLAHIIKVVSGEKVAMREYNRLLQELKPRQESIKVSPEFLKWARAVYTSRKPPEEAVEILGMSRNLDDE